MTEHPQHDAEPQDRGAEGSADVPPEAPHPALAGYPREAAPEPDDDTAPVVVPGEQVSPAHRQDVFPEDDGPT
ncbi:hypothetical protein [Jannaschia sp. R86511]|uniref:hypothetical protein n=1 Tax=Jannaschia sp. R86511 TaxID=3093853 RepID=UPI0036D2890B